MFRLMISIKKGNGSTKTHLNIPLYWPGSSSTSKNLNNN